MAKIRIAGPKPELPRMIAALQDVGAVHIEHEPPDIDRIRTEVPVIRRHTLEASAQRRREMLEALLERVRKLLLLLPPAPGGGLPETPAGAARLPDEIDLPALAELAAQLDAVAARADALVRKRKIHEDELSLFVRYEKVLTALSPLIAMVRESADLECTGLAIRAEDRDVLPLLEEAMARLTGGSYELFHREVDRETLAGLLVYPRGKKEEARALLWEKNIGELRLPASVAEKPLGEALRIIRRKQERLPGMIGRVDGELAALSRRWGARLAALRPWIENGIGQIGVAASFFETGMASILYGWIPLGELARLNGALEAEFGGVVVVEELSAGEPEEDDVPVALVNRRLFRPFEVFTRFLPLPRYGTIDPTPLVAVGFPLFYGIIIGDVGYGLILFAAARLAGRRFQDHPLARDLAAVFSWSALSAAVWGVVFGELFGDLGERLGLRPLLFHRMKDFPEALSFALAIGAAHVVLGIALGAFCALRRGRRAEAVAKTAGLFMVVALLLAAAAALGKAPRIFVTAGPAAALACLAVMLWSEGARAFMELHNLVNILSYLRITGIGVASAALALAANRLGSLAGSPALGIPAAVLLHAVNLAFGIVSPAIQSMRLHYVEFFENFFRGGGRAYRPFKGVA